MQMGDLLLTFRTHDLQQAEVGVCWIVEGGEEEGGFFLRNHGRTSRKRGVTFMIANPGKCTGKCAN